MTTDPQTAADAAAAELTAWLDGRDADDQLGRDLRTLLADRTRLAAELEQARRTVAIRILRQAWRNGWSDRARAVRDAVRVSDNERDAYERAFARYMSEDPAEADKDPYRPLDGPDDPAALPTRDAHRAEEAAEGPQDTLEGP